MRVAILFPTGHLFDTPCVPNLVQSLANKGIVVDIYTVRNNKTPAGEFKSNSVNVFFYPFIQKKNKESVLFLSAAFTLWQSYHLSANKYNYIIGCGIRGLFVAGILSKIYKIPFIYNSLELYSGKKFENRVGKFFKKIEIFFNGIAQMTIIQDEKRGELLKKINNLEGHKICIFPNAPYSDNNVNCRDIKKIENFFNGYKFDILIICSGSLLAEWSGIPAIIKEVPNFKKNELLFLQSRSSLEDVSGLRGVSQLSNCIVSTSPLSANEYNCLVKRSHIGLVWYESQEENIRYVGLSSGKVAHYLKHGKPIIINSLPMYDEIIDKYECGVIVNSAQDIPDAIQKISSEYKKYSQGALYAYKDLFDMDKYAEDIKQYLITHKAQ